MSNLTFTNQRPGHYVAELDGETGVLRWIITNTAASRWEIVSITSEMARIRHGAAHTLREAKEIVNRWHQSNLARVTA